MNTQEIIITIVLVIGVTVIFTLKSKKEKDSSWKGELVKKRTMTDEDGDVYAYKLIFKTDEGKKAKVKVNEEMYNQAQKGERYEKIKGDYIPKKIS
jgi:hypothetical protein